MAKLSAGILLYRQNSGSIEVLIGHPGGPFWARKDAGSWSIPKGEYDTHEDPWVAAQREFAEEIGCPVPHGSPVAFDPVKQPGGKILTIFALEGDIDISAAHSNTFVLEWPKGSGILREYPELDRVAWLSVEQARSKLLRGQVSLLDRLLERIHNDQGFGN